MLTPGPGAARACPDVMAGSIENGGEVTEANKRNGTIVMFRRIGTVEPMARL